MGYGGSCRSSFDDRNLASMISCSLGTLMPRVRDVTGIGSSWFRACRAWSTELLPASLGPMRAMTLSSRLTQVLSARRRNPLRVSEYSRIRSVTASFRVHLPPDGTPSCMRRVLTSDVPCRSYWDQFTSASGEREWPDVPRRQAERQGAADDPVLFVSPRFVGPLPISVPRLEVRLSSSRGLAIQPALHSKGHDLACDGRPWDP